MSQQTKIMRLLEIMKQLRHPETGCEWDLQQTWQSLIPYTLEETYEVIDAIENGDVLQVKKELGDLLYQIVFYAQIAEEAGHFDFMAICDAISDKLIFRHPHVFEPSTTQKKPNWEQLKLAERSDAASQSIVADMPVHFPALMRAQKIQKRCAAVGFDWPNWQGSLEKVHEELDEVQQEIVQHPIDQTHLEEELGDLLFAVVNLTRHLGADAETCLQRANQKFIRRFQQVESLAAKDQQSIADLSLTNLDAKWQQVKAQEKQ